MSYWSTYEAMDKAQQKWYFFWRAEFRQGTVQKTDLSYLFINIYETLHLVGFNNANEAFEYLKRLWQSYRELHPKLDNYLVNWLVDFSEYYDLGKDPLGLTWELAQQGVKTSNSDLTIASWLAHGRPDDLNINMVRTLIDYNPQSGKFYKDTKDKERILDRCKVTLLTVNRFYFETLDKSVFDAFLPKKSINVERQAFAGAVFAFENKMLKIATVKAYSTHEPLREILTSAVKYGENLLRREMGFSGSRRGIELPKNLEDYLKASINPQDEQIVELAKPKREVVIDESRLEKLQLESEAIRKQLLEGKEEELKLEDSSDFNFPAPSAPPKKASRFAIPADTPANLLTELDEVATILDSQVNQVHGLKILHFIKSRGWEALRVDISAAIDDINFENSLDTLNELAINELGDLLIITEDNLLIVSEDYQDELEFLLELPEYSTNFAQPKSGSSKRSSGLSSDWEAFAERLTILHAEALMQLVDSGSTRAAFESFAMSHHAMPSLIIEELNEASLETIGDQIIDSYAEPIHLEEEHHYDILKVITWYYSRGEQ